jgi:hypothetical protein
VVKSVLPIAAWIVYVPAAVAVKTPLLKKPVDAFELVTVYVTLVGVTAVPVLS